MSPIASIVIRCHNEEQHIGRLLSGIMQQTIRDLEIIVVDSGSTDATLAIAARYPVRILHIRPEEFSFGRSLNLGCREARGDYIVIASAHVYPVYDDWIEQLVAPFADPRIGLVYGKQRGDASTRYAEHRVFAHWFPERSDFNQQHPFCNNANAAVRRAIWAELPYDESLTGLEDVDWANRAMRLGWRVAYNAEAEIVHLHDESPQRIFRRYQREAMALRRIFPDQRFGLRDFVRLCAANIASDFFHAWHDGVLGQRAAEIVVFRLMQFWGTYRGFARSGPVSETLRRTFYYPSELVRPRPTSAARSRQPIDYALLAHDDAGGRL